jgi:hypothetical protein
VATAVAGAAADDDTAPVVVVAVPAPEAAEPVAVAAEAPAIDDAPADDANRPGRGRAEGAPARPLAPLPEHANARAHAATAGHRPTEVPAPAVDVPAAATPHAATPDPDAPAPSVAEAAAPAVVAPDAPRVHAPVAPAVAATATTERPAPAAPATPAEQLVGVMRPLRRAEDGAYHLRLELRPPELGRVDLRVELRDGVLHANIRTEHAHVANLVRDALGELRTRLDADGVRAGQLTVGDDAGQSAFRDRNAAQDAPRREESRLGSPDVSANAPTRSDPTTDTDALLDVRI